MEASQWPRWRRISPSAATKVQITVEAAASPSRQVGAGVVSRRHACHYSSSPSRYSNRQHNQSRQRNNRFGRGQFE